MSLDHILNVAAQSPDSQFLPGSKVQYAWDSVSLTSMLACPRRYQYQIIRGLVPKAPSYAIALVFGILFHKGLEVYHKARAQSAHDEAVLAAVKFLLAEPATSTLPTDEVIADVAANFDPDEDDGITLRNSKIRTRYYLFRAVVWYLEQYKEDTVETLIMSNGQPAVELSFRLPIPVQVAGVDVLLCGHIDRGVTYNDRLYNSDYKTTKSLTSQFFKMFDLSHQMTGYTVAGTAIFHESTKGVMIDGVVLQVGQVKMARSFTDRTPGQVAEYFDTVKLVVESAQRAADIDQYPMNTSSCYFCEFKDICSQPPEYRDRYIRQFYFTQPGWNPLENR